MRELVSIVNGNTFVVSSPTGDIEAIPGSPSGLFAFDTRFLSTWVLTVDGERLSALSVDDLQHFETRFFLVPGPPTQYVDAKLSIIRQRTVGTGIEEELTIVNHEGMSVVLTIRIEVGSDYADIFDVKEPRSRRVGEIFARVEGDRLRLGYQRDAFRRETLISSSQPGEFDAHGMTFNVRIEPNATWTTRLSVAAIVGVHPRMDVSDSMQARSLAARPGIRQRRDQWLAAAPRLECDCESLTTAYHRGLVDLFALLHTPPISKGRGMPAAGLPWFMTTFGRDSILTSLQMLPVQPELAAVTLGVMAVVQGAVLDDFREEEPGKIPHEVRYGESAAFEIQPHTIYYGTADATQLFVILLDEYERWTGHADMVRELEFEARQALAWIDQYGDLLGNGYVSYQRRNTKNGLENQCWKDSWDSISYRDGRIPAAPRATCELQGYAYDAKVRAARLAEEFWNDPAYADQLRREAADLKERFNRDFWVEDGEYYALALGPDGTQVDSLSSNIGHLLWSGIVEHTRAKKIADHLLGPRLFSGWGVRTLATDEGRYNPIGYHVGTVWPFDNSFIAWGLWRYGFRAEAARIAHAVLDASDFFQGRLPEAFAGYERSLTKYPVQYPTACSPQAWSSGAPFLLLRVMLGLEPIDNHLTSDPALPENISRIELLDIPGRWGHTDALARQ